MIHKYICNNNLKSMTGVVLCGGQSSRMGSDKGLLCWEGSTWAGTAVAKLQHFSMPVFLSVKDTQYPAYSELFPAEKLIRDSSGLAVNGPLKGLLSVHEQVPDEDLLVLACDIPGMQLPVLEYLLDMYKEQQGNEVYIFSVDQQLQPLCAVYTAAALKKIARQLMEGKLEKHSMMYVLEQCHTCIITSPEAWNSFFTNYNSPGDLPQRGKQ
jgi:molybdopterin-guanine dinucleotide biosynthesis protein A